MSIGRATMLTPPGRGAIATLVVEGPAASAAIARHFVAFRASGRTRGGARSGRSRIEGGIADEPRPAAGLPSSAALRFGHWGERLREEVVVRRCADSRFEIHCHGGAAAAAAILASLEEAGCALVSWKDWLAATEPNRIRAEAAQALAEATTQPAAAVLLDQYAGALERELEELLGAIRHVAAGGEESRLYASAPLAARLSALLARADLGLRLAEPWKVVIAGRPNVGKSTLINAILGYERALTSLLPGTTRDVVTAPAALGGWPVLLADTAGLRPATDGLEQEGVARARSLLQTADLRVLVFDSGVPFEPEDSQLIADWPDAVLVANKIDLPCAKPLPLRCALPVSALTGEGIDALVAALARRLVPQVPPTGGAVPFIPRHVAGLQQAQQAAAEGRWQGVADALQNLLAPQACCDDPEGNSAVSSCQAAASTGI